MLLGRPEGAPGHVLLVRAGECADARTGCVVVSDWLRRDVCRRNEKSPASGGFLRFQSAEWLRNYAYGGEGDRKNANPKQSELVR